MSGYTDQRTTRKRRAIKYIYDIDQIQQLSVSEKAELKKVVSRFPFWANDYYLGLINWNEKNDPIRRLIIPSVVELNECGDLDASNESTVTVAEGVQHKYASTVLLLVNENCAGFCRYCFRKRLFMKNNEETTHDISPGLEYIRRHKEVNNVLITGGDPLVFSSLWLRKILKALRNIEHVKIIRIGTKVPAFNPFRIVNDPNLPKVLSEYSRPDKRIYMVCHYDHPRELTRESRKAIDIIQRAGVICVNQNPIIRGISDDPKVMAELWNELSYMGIPQYYVFQGRPTKGNRPFSVPIVEAYFKIEEAKRYCSGLAKRIRFAMSHESGKVEVAGVDHRHIYLKYHRAKNNADEQRFLVCHRDDNAFWLDQLKPVEGYRNKYYDQSLVLPARVN